MWSPAVAAAASVPSSSTSIKTLWTALSTNNGHSAKVLKSASPVNIAFIPSCHRMSKTWLTLQNYASIFKLWSHLMKRFFQIDLEFYFKFRHKQFYFTGRCLCLCQNVPRKLLFQWSKTLDLIWKDYNQYEIAILNKHQDYSKIWIGSCTYSNLSHLIRYFEKFRIPIFQITMRVSRFVVHRGNGFTIPCCQVKFLVPS